jgi:large subunit ribosomal protein L21
MKAFKVFILGMLYGWLAKFVIDRVYRDQEVESMRNENASLKEYIRSLEARLESKAPEPAPVRRPAPQPKPVQTDSGKDDLKAIKGIGPAIERKLNEAGILTFQALARLTVAELENILGSTKRLVKDEGSLLAQAEQLAQQKK